MSNTIESKFNRKQIVLWLAILGVVTHVILLVSLDSLAHIHADQVRAKMRNDPTYTASYESWEPDWIRAEAVLLFPVFVYIPAILCVALAAAFASRNQLLKLMAITLGVFSLLYAAVIVFVN